jgi:hypothetical protein
MKKHLEKERDRDHHLLVKETTIIIAIIIISQDMKKTTVVREDIITQHHPTKKKRDNISAPEKANTMITKIVIKKNPRKRYCHQRDPKILNKAH